MDRDFSTIYTILRVLRDSMDDDEFDARRISAETLGITENRRRRLLKMLADSKYIEGISIDIAGDGCIMLSMDRPAITLKGLESLAGNTMMQRALRLAKGLKDAIPGV